MSPQNSATTTTSRNDAETKIENRVKLSPPEVASSTRLANSLRPLSSSPPESNWNAIRMISGSNTMNPSASWVRRRDACRRNSATNGMVADGR